MNAQKRKLRMKAAQMALYPLPEGKPETRNCFGIMKRYNPATGKYDQAVN